MNDYDTGEEESTDRRTIRAATESMTVTPTGKARFDVYNVDGRRYGVNLIDGTCTCPDFERRGDTLENGCKHLQRVEMESRIREIPDLGNRRLDVEIARDSRERKVGAVVMTDGGTAAVDADTEGEGDDEPACLCEMVDDDDLGCFEHYEGDAEGSDQ